MLSVLGYRKCKFHFTIYYCLLLSILFHSLRVKAALAKQTALFFLTKGCNKSIKRLWRFCQTALIQPIGRIANVFLQRDKSFSLQGETIILAKRMFSIREENGFSSRREKLGILSDRENAL